MHNLETYFREHLVSKLQRKSITKCSEWALKYRVVGSNSPWPGQWSFKYLPWQRAMHDSNAQMNVGQKAAQMGFTDAVLNITFYNIDIRGKDVLYVLPASTPDATDFTNSRFNPALELSEHLNNIFTDVNNVGHKRAGSSNLYIRGSHTRSALKSIPVSVVILDEVEEMTQANIPLAFERTSGQLQYWHWLLSTPSIDGHGINKYFNESSQQEFFFSCPSCSKFINLKFPDNIVITGTDINDPELENSYLKCDECHNKLHHETKSDYLAEGQWVPKYPRDIAGWHIPKLYSSAKAGTPKEIGTAYLKSLTDASDEQEFYNSTLGVTHAVEGSRITVTQINNCKANYLKLDHPIPNTITTMGVDQGRWIHYEIDSWKLINNNVDLSNAAHCTVLTEGKVRDFEELDDLMRQFRIMMAVIDAQPERRKATEFARRFRGHVRLCFYPEGVNPKQINISDAGDEPSVSVDRTTWLDTSLGRFKKGIDSISLPVNLSMEYQDQIQVPCRVYSKDRHGNPIGRYVDQNRDDHFAHARNYNEIAFPLASSISSSQNITNIW